MGGRDRPSVVRQRMAYEAARIMVEQGLSDFERARRKAAQRTGVVDRRSWPSNEAIQEALMAQSRLFGGEARERKLTHLRGEALKAMRAFASFSPRLVGSVLTGSGQEQLGIQLFLFAENPEDVVFALLDQQIPWHERERAFRFSGGERRNYPIILFMAGDVPFELTVLPVQALRNPPLDPVTERPERGADIAEVERLLADGDRAPNGLAPIPFPG